MFSSIQTNRLPSESSLLTFPLYQVKAATEITLKGASIIGSGVGHALTRYNALYYFYQHVNAGNDHNFRNCPRLYTIITNPLRMAERVVKTVFYIIRHPLHTAIVLTKTALVAGILMGFSVGQALHRLYEDTCRCVHYIDELCLANSYERPYLAIVPILTDIVGNTLNTARKILLFPLGIVVAIVFRIR